MYPESEEQRSAREARLKEMCDSIGLEVHGSMVSLPGFPQFGPFDASAVDLTRGPQALIAMAYSKGRASGLAQSAAA